MTTAFDVNDIPPIDDIADPALAARLRAALDDKTKPLGALGRIEALGARLGGILGTVAPVLVAPQMLVCAADHGLAVRGVSAYPGDVTWQMVENFLSGGAAVSVLARQHGLALTVVDCGVRRDFEPRERLVVRKVARGTADSSSGPAMTAAQCAEAIANGLALVEALPGNAVLLGEMGIGNSSSASMLLARLAGIDIDACTGIGTGLDADGRIRKARDLAHHEALAGFEVATHAAVDHRQGQS
ncbi:MAG: nicotinate-nucleotide--dimethylbenzimidazole phosphoribosyltransferase, partial [Variovorax sp.]